MLISVEQIEKTISNICNILIADLIAKVESWLTIVDNSNGRLLRMNKE